MAGKLLAENLYDASIQLDWIRLLEPGTSAYDRLYVHRPRVEKVESSELLREAERARRDRSFRWFFTGHTGSGKSTELSRIMTDQRLLASYHPIFIDLSSQFDLHNLDYTDVILGLARACAEEAEALQVPSDGSLPEAIRRWGSKYVQEDEKSTKAEGQAGLKLNLLLAILRAEVKSGGSRRETIRKEISSSIMDFIRIIDLHVEAMETYLNKRILCVLDGLDHAEVNRSLEVLYNHFETLMLPKVSMIYVLPLALLNTPFLSQIEGQYSTVPNLKVFSEHGSEALDSDGFGFYRDLIARYVSLDFFESEALESLFKLSAGIVRDMIRHTSQACGHAADDGSLKVTTAHAEQVWNEVRRFFRSQLRAEDYEVLRNVDKQPYLEGINGVPQLLHSKAVVFYPNGEGWYGVHPAVRKMIHSSRLAHGG